MSGETLVRAVASTSEGFVKDAIYRVVGGKLPREYALSFEPYRGPEPDRVLTLDAGMMAAAIARNKRLAQPRPAPAAPLRAADVCAQLGWSTETLARARAELNFPKPDERIEDFESGARATYTWDTKAVTDWLAALQAVAAATKV